jgi:hypothetical protein
MQGLNALLHRCVSDLAPLRLWWNASLDIRQRCDVVSDLAPQALTNYCRNSVSCRRLLCVQ